MFIVISWTPGQDDKETAHYETRQRAMQEAQWLAAEGYNAAVYEEIRFCEAEEIDRAAYNGVTPGVDFPATLGWTA